MNFTGLSLDQAPPISVPLRYFLVAPLFGIAAALVVLFSHGMVLTQFETHTIVVLHLITIGFFSFVMLGALTQMLPVIANATIYRVDTFAGGAHLLLIFGLFCFGFGFLTSETIFLTLSYGFLGTGFFLIIVSIFNAMRTVQHFTPTIKTMMMSLFFASIAVSLGVFMVYGYAQGTLDSTHLVVVNIHSVIAVFGFAVSLIIGVSFQVLPMFYVAPEFKKFCTTKVIWIIGVTLLLWIVVQMSEPRLGVYVKGVLVTFLSAFGTTIFVKFIKRKRKKNDITVAFWISGGVMLLIGLMLWLAQEFIAYNLIVICALFIGTFIFSVMQGMLYKIVPFLVWFHLNGAGYMNVPHTMINKNLAKIQFLIFIVSVLFLIVSRFYNPFLAWGAALFLVSMVLLEINIIAPVRLYIQTKKTKPDFDMSMMTMDNG